LGSIKKRTRGDWSWPRVKRLLKSTDITFYKFGGSGRWRVLRRRRLVEVQPVLKKIGGNASRHVTREAVKRIIFQVVSKVRDTSNDEPRNLVALASFYDANGLHLDRLDLPMQPSQGVQLERITKEFFPARKDSAIGIDSLADVLRIFSFLSPCGFRKVSPKLAKASLEPLHTLLVCQPDLEILVRGVGHAEEARARFHRSASCPALCPSPVESGRLVPDNSFRQNNLANACLAADTTCNPNE
jgi:hypothetical protein